MRIEVNNTIEVASSFSVKLRRHEDDIDSYARLKFTEHFIDREYSDEMLGLPIHATALLYGEDGIPVTKITIGRKHIVYLFAGAITGNKNRNEQIALTGDTQIEKAELQLVENGALLSAQLVWKVKGDEVELLKPLLGKTCIINGLIVLPEQIDAFASAKQAADDITKRFQK